MDLYELEASQSYIAKPSLKKITKNNYKKNYKKQKEHIEFKTVVNP